jgi:predicted nucleic-acid-binding Zn-ribbon protein
MNEVKKCPKCNGEMETGYLRDAPWWRKGTRLPALGFGPRVFAYKCKNCAYIELYAEKKAGVNP